MYIKYHKLYLQIKSITGAKTALFYGHIRSDMYIEGITDLWMRIGDSELV